MAYIHSEEDVSTEAAGAKAGINPMFGEWRQRFDFPPVPTGGRAGRRGPLSRRPSARP